MFHTVLNNESLPLHFSLTENTYFDIICNILFNSLSPATKLICNEFSLEKITLIHSKHLHKNNRSPPILTTSLYIKSFCLSRHIRIVEKKNNTNHHIITFFLLVKTSNLSSINGLFKMFYIFLYVLSHHILATSIYS